MLQDHDFEHLLHLRVGKFTMGDKFTDTGQKGMDIFHWGVGRHWKEAHLKSARNAPQP